MALKGVFLDSAIKSIAKYLLDVSKFYQERGDYFDVNKEVDWLIKRYRFNDKPNELKTDILNMYQYVSQRQTRWIDNGAYINFQKNKLMPNTFLENLDKDLELILN